MINETTPYRAGLARPPRHHVLPQEHQTWFEERGFVGEFSIDRFTIELEEGVHQAIHGGGNFRLGRQWEGEWNRRLMKELKLLESSLGRTLTRDEIMERTGRLLREYGFGEQYLRYRD